MVLIVFNVCIFDMIGEFYIRISIVAQNLVVIFVFIAVHLLVVRVGFLQNGDADIICLPHGTAVEPPSAPDAIEHALQKSQGCIEDVNPHEALVTDPFRVVLPVT